MAGADANRVNLAYIVESTFGVTPSGPPTLQNIRYTGESLGQDTDTTESNEIRSDRQIPDIVRTAIRANGDINIEFSHGAFNDWILAALLGSAWSSAVTSTEITYSMDDADNSINDSGSAFISDGFILNQWIKISGFTTAANNGYFKITSLAAGKMILSGGTVVTEVAGDSVTIKQGEYVEAGTTFRSYSIEREYTDYSNLFAVYLGMAIQNLNLTVTPGSINTGGFGFLGKQETSETATVGDGSNTAAATNDVQNSIDHVSAILENQTSLSCTQVSLALNNNLRERLQIATLGAESIGTGRINLSGTLQAYFGSATLFNKYLDFTASSMAVIFEDGDGNSDIIDIPQIRFTNGRRVAGGINTDIIADLSWSAYMDATETKTLRWARFTA